MNCEAKLAYLKEKFPGLGEDDIAVITEEVEGAEMSRPNNFSHHVTQAMEKFASMRMGQIMLEKSDRILKVVEDTAKWSLSQDESDIQLQRPLPWVFFLFLIVFLRVSRTWLNIALYIMKGEPITPRSMVNYLQAKRRHLRAVRVHGLKTIRNQEVEATVMYKPNKKSSFIEKLSEALSTAICKPGEHREVMTKLEFTSARKIVKDMNENARKRPRDDDDEDDDANLTVTELLDKYAEEDSDTDFDYVPKEVDNDDDASTSYASTSSVEDSQKESLETSSETPKNETMKPKTHAKSEEQNKEEIKENGESKYQLETQKPSKENKQEFQNTTDSDSEQMHTPKGIDETNGFIETEQINKMPAVATEVAPRMSTPKTTTQHLSVPELKQSEEKSTPGHESAASMKPASLPASNEGQTSPPFPDNYYENFGTNIPETMMATGTQRKNINNNNHYKPSHHFNAKNRSKNRR